MNAKWTCSWPSCKRGVPRRVLPVRLSSRFRVEFKHQIAWIAERNLKAAQAAESRVRVALRRLGRFPELGRPGRVDGTRELSVVRTRFVIAYRVRESVVEVAAWCMTHNNGHSTSDSGPMRDQLKRLATSLPIASDDVSPGLSMPNRHTSPATLSSITKSPCGSLGPCSLGRMPA